MGGTTGSGIAMRPSATAETRAVPWYAQGILAGFFGAGVIAVFFLVFDLVAGRPLWTPQALGSALFLGEWPDPSAPIAWVLVLGYTAIHFGFFHAFGVMAAFEVLTAKRMRSAWVAGVVTALALFLVFEISFLALAGLIEPRLLDELGTGRVAVANALAAIAMSAYLLFWRKHYGGPAEA